MEVMMKKFWFGVECVGACIAFIGLGCEAASALVPVGIICFGGLICYIGKTMEDRYAEV